MPDRDDLPSAEALEPLKTKQPMSLRELRPKPPEPEPEPQDKVLMVTGWVFGTLFYLMMLGCSLLPYITAFPGPSPSCRVAMELLGGVLLALLTFGITRSAIGAAQRDKPGWFLRTHQLLLIIPVYVVLGGFGVMFLALVNPIAGWALVGAVVLGALLFAYFFYHCPQCRRLFAAELVLVEKTGEHTGTSLTRDAQGRSISVQTTYSRHRRTYRCRFCLSTWSR